MIVNMNNKVFRIVFICTLGLLFGSRGYAQDNTYQSVLSEHTWHRLAVTQEHVYKLDYATLEAMGIDMETLNPNEIRLFGNPSGALPEKNSEARPDDLTEMAIYVVGADDGSFDSEDMVLFYGQEPTRWRLKDEGNDTYARERNLFSDTTYYYLCVDSGVEGLRIGQKATLPVEDATNVISDFPDFVWHEEELFSPYFQGQNWYGEQLKDPETPFMLSFVLPNLVKTKPLLVKSQVLGRISTGSMRYNLWVNDNHLADNLMIGKLSTHYYGRMSTLAKQAMSESDTLSVQLSFGAESTASLFVDYIEIYGWRQLKRVGSFFPFRLMPSQFGNGKSAIWVQNTNAQYWLWEVTDPLRPVLQEGILSGGNYVFATDERTEKRYAMFNPDRALPVDHWSVLPNQNVHGIGEVDMLILTSIEFKTQAQALADYHDERDGLRSAVVDVNEIYNEFGTGHPDPSAIRDFVRMVYLRSSGRLRYLTLFGRASTDYRNIMGYGQNFVPTYESADSSFWELDFCADDYFGLMDPEEGAKCDGRVDIGIGRIPVSTVEEADMIVRKIKHYDDLAATHGIWKTDMLMFADDEVTTYVDYSETYCRMFDTLKPAIRAKKLYTGAYPTVSTSSGTEIPGANADLKRFFDEGALLMLYTGHGGVKGLTGENVFTNADINRLSNLDKMPFVYTATCEFTKYDNPLVVSAGEKMFLNPNGGSVAMFTTCRPTYGIDNNKQTKAFVNVFFDLDEEGQPQRFGDIVRLSKSDPLNYSGNTSQKNINIRFLFLGDPALRLPVPNQEVVIQKINGQWAGTSDNIELHAMSMVTMEGVVKNRTGNVDAGFNGTLWVRLFDKASKIKVDRYGSNSRNVYCHKNILYHGMVSVVNGRFTISFQVPKDIMPEMGAPRFALYAYDSIRGIDAMGKYDGLILGGIDPAMVADDEGPKIDFYWNTPDFVNGQSVERQGVLYADLYDAQGIYHYDFSLGRDIMLNSNLMAYDHLVVNDCFEPALNDFRRGRIAIPVSDLTPGTYEFGLKVWDTQNNPSEASLWFVVDDDLFLSQVHNYPNPFSDETRITMTHIGEDGNFDVNIEIFDCMGRPVQRLQKRVTATDGVIEPIRWDGCSYSGTPLRSGVYLYRLTLTDESGFFRTVSQRMVISR
jgi:hypothetical protein